MYACSPKWPADWISEQDLEHLLSLLAERIVPNPWRSQTISLNHGLHFTGGEPFLNPNLLVKAVEIAKAFGIPSTFAETNCSWCRGDEEARHELERLKRAGLQGVLISVNPFYAEWVPFERTERCIRISQEVFGANVMVYQQAYYHQFKQLGIKDRLSLQDYMELVKGERLADRVELFLMGRAACQLREFYPAYPARRFFSEPCRPPFLRDWHNHFDNYGNLVPGYCGGISLGHWQDLDRLIQEGIDLDEHPVLRFLIAENVQGLLHFAKDAGYREREDGYLSKCDLCLDIRRYLVSREDLDKLTVCLSPKEFYAHLA